MACALRLGHLPLCPWVVDTEGCATLYFSQITCCHLNARERPRPRGNTLQYSTDFSAQHTLGMDLLFCWLLLGLSKWWQVYFTCLFKQVNLTKPLESVAVTLGINSTKNGKNIPLVPGNYYLSEQSHSYHWRRNSVEIETFSFTFPRLLYSFK